MLSFFPRGVLDEILNLIVSVFEGFPTYFFRKIFNFDNKTNQRPAIFHNTTESSPQKRRGLHNSHVFTVVQPIMTTLKDRKDQILVFNGRSS